MKDWDSADEGEMEQMAASMGSFGDGNTDGDSKNGNSNARRAIAAGKIHQRACDVLMNLLSTATSAAEGNELILNDINELKERAAVTLYNAVIGKFFTGEERKAVFQSLLNNINNNKSGLVPYVVQTFSEILGNDDGMGLSGMVDGNLLSSLIEILGGGRNNNEAIRMETVSTLNALMNMAHSRETNMIVGRGLMERLEMEGSVCVLQEVLNAIMDIYGADDFQNGEMWKRSDVFVDLGLGQALQEFVTVFRRRIKEEARRGTDEEELMVWKETALNLQRFVKYKGSS